MGRSCKCSSVTALPPPAPGTSQWLPLLPRAPVSGAVPFTPPAAGTMEMPE